MSSLPLSSATLSEDLELLLRTPISLFLPVSNHWRLYSSSDLQTSAKIHRYQFHLLSSPGGRDSPPAEFAEAFAEVEPASSGPAASRSAKLSVPSRKASKRSFCFGFPTLIRVLDAGLQPNCSSIPFIAFEAILIVF